MEGKAAIVAGKAPRGLSGAAALAPVRRPARAGKSEAGRLLRAGFANSAKPKTVSVKLFENPAGERFISEQFTPTKPLQRGVLTLYNRFAGLRRNDDGDGLDADYDSDDIDADSDSDSDGDDGDSDDDGLDADSDSDGDEEDAAPAAVVGEVGEGGADAQV